MSNKELNKAMVVGLVIEKKITQKEAAKRLSLSTRQIKRLVKKIRSEGPSSIAHGSRGKPKPHKYCINIQNKIVSLIQEKYYDFGPTLAAEKLKELDGIQVSNEWLRTLMIKRGLWRAKQRRMPVHSPRARRPRYGDLIQIDGSHHAWFEERGPKCVVLVFVDDATGRIQTVHFCPSENLKGYLVATKSYLEQHGCPKEIYTDKHSVFTINHMRGGEQKGKSHYAKVLSEFNIKQHLANSPQAKGRVERMNRTLQDRLLKELRLNNICTIEAANDFMPKFIEKYNTQFSRVPKEAINSHLLLTQEQIDNMDRILAIKEHRRVSKALTVQYLNRIYVINQVRAIRSLRKQGVMVHEMLNGEVKMFFNDTELAIEFFEYANNYIPSTSRKELDIELDSQEHKKEANKTEIPGSLIQQKGTLSPWTTRGHF